MDKKAANSPTASKEKGTPATPKTSASSYKDKDKGTFMDEWKEARGLMRFFDDKLHDIRKYGFSFLTVLLTAQAILIPSKDPMPDMAKLGVFIITLLLIATLYLLDKNYVSFQEAANTRLMVLERKLNLELSDIISLRYRTEGISRHVMLIYWLIITGVFILGCFSFEEKQIYIPVLGSVVVVVISYIIFLHARNKFYRHYPDDWIVSPLQCTAQDPVAVMVTNLAGKRRKICKEDLGYQGRNDLQDGLIDPPIIFKKDEKILDIINQQDFSVKTVVAEETITVYDSYTKILTWDDFGGNGIYKIRPRGRFLPLDHTVIVCDSDPGSGSTNG